MQCRLLWSFSRILQTLSAVNFNLSLMIYLVRTHQLLVLPGTWVCYVVNFIPSISIWCSTHKFKSLIFETKITTTEWRGRPFPFSKGCSFYRLDVSEGTRKIMYVFYHINFRIASKLNCKSHFHFYLLLLKTYMNVLNN